MEMFPKRMICCLCALLPCPTPSMPLLITILNCMMGIWMSQDKNHVQIKIKVGSFWHSRIYFSLFLIPTEKQSLDFVLEENEGEMYLYLRSVLSLTQ